ncbi:MAG TPA: HEAT repeat domain-containing protein [Armatimonadota bacterium]|nr:HEAT repeat domain-containing protein [Armatimonadota bacterium]
MTRMMKYAVTMVVLLASSCAFAQDADVLIGRLSDDDGNVRLEAARELATLGPDVLPELMALVGGDDERLAAGARIAVGVLCQNLTAPDAAADFLTRSTAEAALLRAAIGPGTVPARQYALRQLALIGQAGSVAGIADLLGDADVGDMARFALARIPGQASLDALAEAADTPDATLRAGIADALGRHGDPAAIRTLEALMTDDDSGVRMVAVQALGEIADPSVGAIIMTAVQSGSATERESARDAYIRLGGTLLAAGMDAEARRVFDRVFTSFPTDIEKCAGLEGWAKIAGATGASRLIAAIKQGSRDIRGVAKYALAEIDEAGVTGTVAIASGAGKTDPRVALIWVLGERGDDAATPVLTEALTDDDAKIRVAALTALGKLRDPLSAGAVIAALADEDEVVRKSAEATLGRIPGGDAADAIVDAIDGADDPTPIMLARTLGRHTGRSTDAKLVELLNDPLEDVRVTAIEALGRHQTSAAAGELVAAALSDREKESNAAKAALTGMTAEGATMAILGEYRAATPEAKAIILRALGARGDAELVGLFTDAAGSFEEEVVVAGLDALAKLHDESSTDLVLGIARDGSDAEKSAAVKAYLEIGKAIAEEDKPAGLAIYHDALALATGDGEKRVALQYLATLGDPDSLPKVQPLLETGSDEVKKAAAGAVVAIADTLANSGQGTQALTLLESSIALLTDRATIARAAQRMRALGKPLMIGAKDGFLTEYWVLGPVSNRDALRKDDILPTDAPVNVARSVDYGDDQSAAWKHRPTDDPLGHVDLEKAAARQDNVGAYCYVEFDAEAAQDVLLKIGSDDGLACWLNGEEVHENFLNRGWSVDADVVEARIEAGNNRLLCKVLNGGAQWALSVRITDRDGKPVLVQQWDKSPADIVADKGFITSYWTLGPLPGREDQRETDAVDAANLDLTEIVTVGDEDFGWQWTALESADGILDLQAAVASLTDVGCFLFAEVTSDTAQDVLLKMGSDDDIYCWLNGELIHENPTARPPAVDQDVVEARLRAGKNQILLKVLQGGGGWAACVRITDRGGNPLVLEQSTP